MESKVFWIGLEYDYLKGHESYPKLEGGFVYAFINGKDVRDVLNRLLVELDELQLKPIEVEFISPYEEDTEWESDEITNHYLELYQLSQESKEVIFDTFEAYEKDATTLRKV
jgi:hypothetical protein